MDLHTCKFYSQKRTTIKPYYFLDSVPHQLHQQKHFRHLTDCRQNFQNKHYRPRIRSMKTLKKITWSLRSNRKITTTTTLSIRKSAFPLIKKSSKKIQTHPIPQINQSNTTPPHTQFENNPELHSKQPHCPISNLISLHLLTFPNNGCSSCKTISLIL